MWSPLVLRLVRILVSTNPLLPRKLTNVPWKNSEWKGDPSLLKCPPFLGGHVGFRFFCFFRFSQNLCVASTWVFLKHAIFGVKKRRMQPWVSWCLELGPSFVSGSPGAAKLIFEGFKLTADPRILASNRWKLPWCYSWFNMYVGLWSIFFDGPF